MLLPLNIHAFTSQYQCFSGVFSGVSGGKRPSFFLLFCNALTVKALQNERESRIYARIFWLGFHLLINWRFARCAQNEEWRMKNEESGLRYFAWVFPVEYFQINKSNSYSSFFILHSSFLLRLSQKVENHWYLPLGESVCSAFVASFW